MQNKGLHGLQNYVHLMQSGNIMAKSWYKLVFLFLALTDKIFYFVQISSRSISDHKKYPSINSVITKINGHFDLLAW